MTSTEEILSKLISYKTVTGNFNVTTYLIDYIDNFLTDCGFYVKRLTNNEYGSLLASSRKDNLMKPRLSLAAHLDVVDGPDELFKLREEGDKLFGRGAFDMKFAVASYLSLARRISEHVDDYDLGFMFTTDEEIGGYNGVRWLLEEGYKPTFCILPDHGNHDFWNIEESSKGLIEIKVVAKGKAGHSSRVWEGENAITKLGKFLYDLNEKHFKDQGPTTSTFSINQIKGGLAPTLTQIPDHAEAYLDFRFASKKDRVRLIAEIYDMATDHDVVIDEVLVDGPVHTIDRNSPMVSELVRSIENVTGEKIQYVHAYGTTDARYFDGKDLECVVPGLPGGGHHGNNEWIDRKAIGQFEKVLSDYVEKVARYDTPFLTSQVKSTTIKVFRPETVAGHRP